LKSNFIELDNARKYHHGFLLSLTILFILNAWQVNSQADSRPNIIFIMVDDLGYGDIGCYGNKKFQTPNIDRLAGEGLLFTDYHANGATCSPTRAALMTGQYQYRFGEKFERPLDGSFNGPDNGLPGEAVTIAEVLKNAGYATGMFGKWHLGYKPPLLPSDQGFDEFIGLGYGDGDHFTHVDRMGNLDWWHNGTRKMEVGYSVDLITRHSVEFIKKNKNRPFFLFVSHLAIHFPWQGPGDPPHRVEGVNYKNDKWGIIPDRKNVSSHIKHMVQAVDTSVGKIVQLLRETGIEKNTLIIFTSDNGGYIKYEPGGFENISSNGPFRGEKGDVWEGGHRVPFIASWPGTIKPGTVTNTTIMTMDMFPTFAALAGISEVDRFKPDGVNIWPHLIHNKKMKHRAVYWKVGNSHAVRKGNWKLDVIKGGKALLFNVEKDKGEVKDVANKKPALVKKLLAGYKQWEREVTSGYQSGK
jgi:arylsulfatase A-like enzyme